MKEQKKENEEMLTGLFFEVCIADIVFEGDSAYEYGQSRYPVFRNRIFDTAAGGGKGAVDEYLYRLVAGPVTANVEDYDALAAAIELLRTPTQTGGIVGDLGRRCDFYDLSRPN